MWTGDAAVSTEVLTLAAIKAAVAADVARLAENEATVREGIEPAGVHQARVACRRLRSQLRTFEKALRSAKVAELEGELAWFGDVLGAVRDLDVLSVRLAEDCVHADEDLGRAILRRCSIDRQEAFSDLIVAMRSARYRRLVSRLAAVAASPPVKSSHAGRPAAEVLLPEVRRRWRALETEVGALPIAAADPQLHRIRILSKRARYAAEISTPFASAELEQLARRLAKVQKVLGELNDAAQAVAWLEALKAGPWDAGIHLEPGRDPLVAVEVALAAEHTKLALQRSGWHRRFVRAQEAAAVVGWSSDVAAPGEGRGAGTAEVAPAPAAEPASARLRAVNVRP